MGSSEQQFEDEPRFTKETFFYDIAILFFNWLYYIFFREVKTRGSFNIPQKGPVIFVCAPHLNQFVDPSLFMLQVKKQTGRNVSFLIAMVSAKRKFIGFLSRLANAIPVERSQDLLKIVEGGTIRFEDFDKDPTLIVGENTHFQRDFDVKGLIGLPQGAGSSQIEEIYSDTRLKLKKPFKFDKAKLLLTKGTVFKYAPKVDNSQVFGAVFRHLHNHGVIGIFPEGGSHDRTELLPLKPGVLIMALGAVLENPETEIKIIPCGMNYFHPNKFRSRAVIEFGTPLVVTAKDGEYYKENTRDAVSKLLAKVTDALNSVIVTCPDYDALMTIQLSRRLYQMPHKHIPLPLVVEMNRRMAIGYVKYQDDPRVKELTKLVNHYNRALSAVGLKDHQLATIERFNGPKTFALLVGRLLKLIVFLVLSLPGTILFAPVLISCRLYSQKKAKELLLKSVVKIRATDVLLTWKLLFALLFLPILYILYSIIGTIILRKKHWIPIVSSNSVVLSFILCYLILVMTTYSAFRIGEVGMDIFKSLAPLILSLTSEKSEIFKLQKERETLSLKVTEICNELGPSVFPDFEEFYNLGLSKEKELEEELRGADDETRDQTLKKVRSGSSLSSGINDQQNVNLSDVPIFSDLTNSVHLRTSSRSSSSDSIPIQTSTVKSTGVSTEQDISDKIKERFVRNNQENFDEE